MIDDPFSDLPENLTGDDELKDFLATKGNPLADDMDDLTGDDHIDALLADMDDPLAETDVDDLTHDPYSVVERTVKCGKDDCACADDSDAEHGPYRYHVHTDPDGSRRWEYVGPAYDV